MRHEHGLMITSGRKAKAVLIVLFIAITRGSLAEPPNASAGSPTGVRPGPLANFGLRMGPTGPAKTGLSGLWSSMAEVAAERACINRCPPSTWSIRDPALAPLGKTTGPGLAMGAGGAGLAIGRTIGRIALRSTRKATATLARTVLQSLAIKPMSAGAGLSINF
jgi:hypothetical protein